VHTVNGKAGYFRENFEQSFSEKSPLKSKQQFASGPNTSFVSTSGTKTTNAQGVHQRGNIIVTDNRFGGSHDLRDSNPT